MNYNFYSWFYTDNDENKCYKLPAETAVKNSWCPMCCKNDKIATRSIVFPAATETRCDGHETGVFSMV